MSSETFTYQLLDNQDNVLRTLPGVQPGGLIESSVHADIRCSGSIDWKRTGDIDWLSHRLRILYNGHPLITGLVAVTGETATASGTDLQLDVYDKTSILLDDSFGAAYALPEGANAIAAVVEVLLSTGETKISIPPNPAVLPTVRVWDAATSKLRIVNDLLIDVAGYFAIWADGLGWFRADPYTPPDQRPQTFEFAGRTGDRYLPTVARNTDPFKTPNRVIAVGTTDGASEAPSATATDERPENPFAYLNRGFWRTHVEVDVPAADLTAYAARRLAELQQPYETHEVTHPWTGATLNDAGTYQGTPVVIQKQRQRLQTGGLVESTVRTVL